MDSFPNYDFNAATDSQPLDSLPQGHRFTTSSILIPLDSEPQLHEFSSENSSSDYYSEGEDVYPEDTGAINSTPGPLLELGQAHEVTAYPFFDTIPIPDVPVVPDMLTPEVGTNGTLISISFMFDNNFAQDQKVHFHRRYHGHIEQKANVQNGQLLYVPFLDKPELAGIKVAVFDVEVVGILHTPLKFIWVAPSTMEALDFIKKRGLPPNLGGRDEEDDDYNDYGTVPFHSILLFSFFSVVARRWNNSPPLFPQRRSSRNSPKRKRTPW